jgi:hypothetical protein
MFSLLVYNDSTAAAGASNYDMTAALDPNFSQRNGHYILSEPYTALAISAMGASVTEARFNVPHLNAIGFANIWPLDRSATPQSPKRIMDLTADPLDLPVNEEIAFQLSNNLACGTEAETVGLIIGTTDWTRNLRNPPSPSGTGRVNEKLAGRRIPLRFTCAYASTAHKWGGAQGITFETTLRGGWYCVLSCWVYSADGRYFRIWFPRMPLYRGRKLTPGWEVSHALGDIEWPQIGNWLGEWGCFHSFEPPQIDLFEDATNSPDNIVGILDCVYMGDGPAPAGYGATGAEIQ